MSSNYDNPHDRRNMLVKWLRREYGEGLFNAREASEAKDIWTPLYASESTARADLRVLLSEERVTREDAQWRLTPEGT